MLEHRRHPVGAKRTRNVFYALAPDLDEIVIGKRTIRIPLDVMERPLNRVLIKPGLETVQLAQELLKLQRLGIVRAQDLLERILGPLLIPRRDGAVPAVKEVELDGDLVARSLRRRLAKDVVPVLNAGVESPRRVGPIDVKDGSHVITQDDVDVEAAGDEATRLEEILIVLGQSGVTEGLLRFLGLALKLTGGGFLLEAATFVDAMKC